MARTVYETYYCRVEVGAGGIQEAEGRLAEQKINLLSKLGFFLTDVDESKAFLNYIKGKKFLCAVVKFTGEIE